MTEYKLEQKRKDYQESLEASLNRIIHQLSEIPEVYKVISFGSYASGRRDLFTDIDLIVIMDTEKGFVQRTTSLYQVLESDVDLDLLVYTPDEFDRMKDRGFLRKALQDGQVIHEKKRA